MHPVLARYLDPEAARDVLRSAEDGNLFPPEDLDFVEAAGAFAPEKRTVLKAGQKLDTKAQQAVLFLATHAALRAIRRDPKLRPELDQTEAALRELGAEDNDIGAVFAQLVADEAFGTDQDPGDFDSEWFLESLRTLPKLLSLDEDEVMATISKFANATAKDSRMRETVARIFLEAAWSEGATPLSAEHLEDALDELQDELGEKEFPRAAIILAEFIELLAAQGLVGKQRADRLAKTARQASVSGPASES